MKENKIFIDNFYKQRVTLGLLSQESNKNYNVITGFHDRENDIIIKQQVVSEIFKALLLHDKIAFSTSDLLQVIGAFGIEDTISLLNTNRFELIDDQGSTLALEEQSINKYGSALFSVKPEHDPSRHSVNASATHVPKDDD